MARCGFWAWTLLIYSIKSITLLSYLWILSLVWRAFSLPEGLFASRTPCPTLVEIFFTFWMMVEACYFPYWLLTHKRLNKRVPSMHACGSQQERTSLLAKCLAASKLASSAADDRAFEVYREWFLRWFKGTQPSQNLVVRLEHIRKQNLEEWLAWAFFDEEMDAIKRNSARSSDCSHLASLVEQALHIEFPPGYNPQLSCIRLTIDPVFASQRPLVYYVAINLLLSLGKIGIYLLGYRRRIVNGHGIFFRPAAYTNRSFATATPSTPIVFCHGLGIGFLHYLRVLKSFPTSSPVYLLTFPNITMTLGAETQPSIADTQKLVQALLLQDRHDSACFVAHSFGTICLSWLLNSSDPAVRSMVKSAVIIDPINLMLFDPAVASNFVHRRPCNSIQLMMSYFVSQELYIAHTLARMFSWSHAVLFLEYIPEDVRVEVLLSGDDAIVPVKLVKAYVEQHQNAIKREKSTVGGGGDMTQNRALVSLMCFEKVHHGQLMLHRRYVSKISDAILRSIHAASEDNDSDDQKCGG